MTDLVQSDNGPRADVSGAGATEEETRSYTRSPEDVLRLVAFATIALVLLGLTVLVEDSILGFEQDIIALFGFLSPTIERVLLGSLEVGIAVVTLALLVIPLATKRYRLFGYLFAASIAAAVLMALVDALVERQVSTLLVNEVADRAGIGDDVSVGPAGLAQLVAVFIAFGPFVSRRWRRAGAITVVAVTLLSLLVSRRLPTDMLVALPLGAACGSAILFAFGRPDRRPTLSAISAALADTGLAIEEVHPAKVDARGSTPYFATLTDGTRLFVKVLGSEQRAADLLFRVYRFLRLKDVGDDRPFSSLRRTVEHEALVSLMAHNEQVRTPRLRGVVDVGTDSMLLAYEMIDGDSLDGLEGGEITDELMRGIWEQVAILRSHRIAHRDLRRANVFVQSDGEPWLIDFGFSEVAVDDDILDADTAQLLASLAVTAGAQRTVAAAVEAIGPDTVGAALPRLQKAALSGATQASLKEHKGLLEDLQQEVLAQTGVEDVQFAELERVNRKVIVTIVALALATYFLYPQLADLPGIVDEVREANWGWTPLIIVFSAMTYVAASMSLAGAIPRHLPAGPLVTTSFGSSFASKLAPAGIGGMALNIRFLQKQGVDQPVAVSGIGLNTIAGLVGHITLVGVFLIWAGRDAFGSIELPNPKWFLIGIGIAAGLFLIGLAIPSVRTKMAKRLVPVISNAFEGITTVLRRPGKVALLLGGSLLVTFSYLTTLYFSIAAFGGGLAFATVGAVFLVGSAIAQAAPTPGGLGAVEAALIAGLVAAGLDNTVAVPAVFLYRLFTFWVPILPGWLAFQWLETKEYI
ncbi:MAG TPA: flippase-like domain-containing protein [Acidimicrobiales bacterium]|nr:flippase-like domain-containing protein [Acidimicrobiales bacterium]